MSGSIFGNHFRITTWGESHGEAIGVVIDGCPAGLPLEASEIQQFLDRRKPGQNKYTTQRKESDQVEILSGLFEGKTTGTTISLLVRNQDQRSKDYGNLAYTYRPGHADYTFTQKYGIRDYRGGGRSSGRETIGRVAAGAIASKILMQFGIVMKTYTKAIGPICIPSAEYNYEHIAQNILFMPNNKYAQQASEYLDDCLKNSDSSGGIIECIVDGMPVGLGEPVFDKLDASIAAAWMSIGAVKGVEIGDGFSVSTSRGSENNDAFVVCDDKIQKETNHSGGILGGISDGSQLIIRGAVKPTPSISSAQKTVTESRDETVLNIHGRHDPVIVPRAVVVAESMTALVVLDLLMSNMTASLDKMLTFYEK